MATYHLSYYTLIPTRHPDEPHYEPVCQYFEADSFIEAVEEMNDWLDVERAFTPVVFNSFSLVHDQWSYDANELPMTA